jgi:hypothetical protein
MSWIDERLAESGETERVNQLIAEGAEKVYEDLWKEVMGFAEEAKTKGFMIRPNDSPHERLLRLFRDPHDQRLERAEELRLGLAPDKKTITGSTRTAQFRFDLDVCDGGIICLKIDGGRISMRDAAIKIVDRWLFPSLPEKW